MKKGIYFDNAATTRLDPRVLDTMVTYFENNYGNASSLHTFGTVAKESLDNARTIIASSIGANPDEIYFTSSGSESNNLALKGIAFANKDKGKHIIVSAIEHDCILNSCKWLEEQGFYVSYLPVDKYGVVDVEHLSKLINPQTILVSVMYANNEIGTIEPIEAIGRLCKEKNVPFHTDACQSFGKVAINVDQSNISMMTINAHKIYGPQGVGALYVRRGIKITPLLHGGGQEAGLRSSTENIAGIIGFAKATEICMQELESETKRLTMLRSKIVEFLDSHYENVYFNGHPQQHLPGLLSFNFSGLEGETIRLLLMLDEKGIAVSAGSACSSNDKSSSTSHVLQAIGLNPFEAKGSIRLSLGRFNTELDVDTFNQTMNNVVRQLNPIFS